MHIVDRDLALRLINDIPSGELRERWVRELVPREVRRDPREAWRWATSLPADLQETSGAVTTAFASWYGLDRNAAVNHLLALRSSPVRDQALLAAVQDFANRPTQYDHSLIDRFLHAISGADAKRQAARILRDHYTTTDPNPARAERYMRQLAAGVIFPTRAPPQQPLSPPGR